MECEPENSEKDSSVVADDKELSKPVVPEDEEILGSMTTYNAAEGSDAKTQQLRSSARVYKKMKLDTTPLVSIEKPDKKEEEVKLEHKRSFRMLWASHDKDLFFEALNEYGKDFESILSFICSKSKKKGLPENLVKTRDQVRHLYYRTWHKISKHLQFSEGINKVAQELYGLINYGEMRRKTRIVNQRYIYSKLQELIYIGTIAMRDKGKTTRIKTPMCRALRRLNQLDERYDELKLPARIALELKPKNMHAYLKVQSMAQNPRLRTIVPLHKRLASVILSISKRWKTIEAHVYDKAIVSKSVITNDCIPNEVESDGQKVFLSPLLRFTPPDDVEIEVPSINLTEYFTRQSICLRAYENKLGIKNSENQLLEQNQLNLKILSKGLPKKVIPKEHASTQELDDVREVVSSIFQLQNTVEGASLESDKKHDICVTPSKTIVEDDSLEKQAPSKIEQIRKGWTLSNCATISIGDLYLMFGKHSKLVIEYSWDAPQRAANNDCSVNEPTAESVGSTVEELGINSNKNSEETHISPENEWESSISSSLKKLISIAKIHYRKNNKCLCNSTPSIKGGISAKAKSTPRTKSQPCESSELNEPFNDDGLFDENAVDGDPSAGVPDSTISSSQISSFRRPNVPTVPMVHLITQLDSIQKLKPRYRKNRRPRFNQMVVERQLSLLPNNTAGGQIVRMNIIPQTNKINELATVEETGATQFTERIIANSSALTFKEENFFQLHNITELPADIQENPNYEGFDTSDMAGITATPSTSPSRILKENDNQWLNAEVADFSLSSFLGRLDSPSKTLMSVPVGNEECTTNEETIS